MPRGLGQNPMEEGLPWLFRRSSPSAWQTPESASSLWLVNAFG